MAAAGEQANYFIAIFVSDLDIRSKVETVQKEVVSHDKRLERFLIPSESLHLTLLAIHLEKDKQEQIEKAKKILEQCRTILSSGPFTIKLKGLDYFLYNPEPSDPTTEKVPRVLYVKPGENGNERLYDVAEGVRDTFTNQGIPSADPRKWEPHIAVIKLWDNTSKVKEIPKKSFEEYIDWDFGEEQVSSLRLCEMGAKKDKDGFYKYNCVKEIDFKADDEFDN